LKSNSLDGDAARIYGILMNIEDYSRGYDDGLYAARTPGADVANALMLGGALDTPSYRKGYQDGLNGHEFEPGEVGLFDADSDDTNEDTGEDIEREDLEIESQAREFVERYWASSKAQTLSGTVKKEPVEVPALPFAWTRVGKNIMARPFDFVWGTLCVMFWTILIFGLIGSFLGAIFGDFVVGGLCFGAAVGLIFVLWSSGTSEDS
jgi:hypothetical protein